jgi:tRNA-specific 2-thiouridylase
MALDRPDTLNSLGFARRPRRRGWSSRCRAASTVPSWPRMLAEEGYDVVGVTLQLYDHGAALAKKGACCAGRDIHDARRVAEEMGFPHYVLDYENTFREAVIDEFADSYSPAPRRCPASAATNG